MANRFLREANLIGGAWVQADSGKVIDVTNPATGEKIGTVPRSGAAETRRAIDAAQEAFLVWHKTSALHRSQMLRKLHDAIIDNVPVPNPRAALRASGTTDVSVPEDHSMVGLPLGVPLPSAFQAADSAPSRPRPDCA